MAFQSSEPPLSPPLEPSKEVSRAHLAAALLDYDAPEHPDGPFSNDSAAGRSAILTPFRHLFVSHKEPQDEPEEQGYFVAIDVAESQLRPGTYSAGGRASPMFGGGSSERGSIDPLANRKSMGPSLMGWEDEEQDPEAEERLANEWGLGQIMDQLGSGSLPTSPVETLLPLPRGMLSNAEAQMDADETRSMPDLDRPRALSTASLLEPSASSAVGEGEDPPLARRIRILERRGSASRARTQSLSDALQLPSFGDLSSFADSADFSSGRPSFSPDPLGNSNIATSRLSSYSTSPVTNRHSLFSLGDQTTAEEPNPRVSSSFARPGRSTTASRPLSRFSVAPSTTLDPPSRGEPADDEADDSRPLSSLSMRPTTPATFTSRFDPTFLAAQRQEVEKERPVFVNKDAGAPPAVVLMPAPLAGRPRSPPPKLRKEGHESDKEEENQEEETLNDEEAHPASQRPAGALYGRSLMDVMAERQNLQKSRARHYVSGQDGRRSMMDWGDSPAGQKLLAAHGVAAEVEGGPETGAETTGLGAARRSKSAMSIFGPDLVYQRDMERLKVIEAEEAKEREAQEERERIVWEKEREKQEKKRSGKGKLLKTGRPSGEFPRDGFSDVARSPPTSPQYPTSPVRPQQGGHSAMVPSISLPSGLSDPADLSTSSWFPAPASPKASSSTASDDNDDYQPPPVPSRIPLSSSPLNPPKKTAEQEKTSAEHSERLRRAVMMGDMTPSQAADESLLLGLGSGTGSHSTASDTRPLGERCNPATYPSAGQAPPLLHLDLGIAEDEDGWRLTDRERGQIREVRGDRPPSPPSTSLPTESSAGAPLNDDDDEDDIPLALRASMLPSYRGSSSHVGGGGVPTFDEEDDVPLGVRASMLPPFQREGEDEDDRPLGYAAMGHNSYHQQQQQQQQQFYLQQQQHHSQAARFQQEQFAFAMAQQQSYNHYAASEMGSIGGGGGGMVEKWRRGVES